MAIVLAQLVQLKPVAGVHTYDVAPEPAKSVSELPGQIAEPLGAMLMLGVGFTVTVTGAVLVQLPDVPVTV